MDIELMIPGDPMPKGSFTRTKTGGFFWGRGTGHERHKEWAHRVKSGAERSMRANGVETVCDAPFAADLTFYMPRPKSAAKRVHCSVKPDLDKLIRAALDPIVGIVVSEDSRMVQVQARKVYADAENPPGVWLRLWSV